MLAATFLELIGKYQDAAEVRQAYWKEIQTQYSGPNRNYHSLEHLENMLYELEEVKPQIISLDALLFSIFYHDLIYEAIRTDNESASAVVFRERIGQTSFEQIEKCCTQIEATKQHLFSADSDTNYLLDLDLSILGKAPAVYTEYSENVRKEYAVFPDELYFPGRKNVLSKMLEGPRIYHTPYFRDKYEAKAGENIRAEIAQLEAKMSKT